MKNQFKPFQRVLVRDPIYGKWEADIYSHFDASEAVDNGPHFCVGGCYDEGNCIPYEGNEVLLGTTGDLHQYKWGDKIEYLNGHAAWEPAIFVEKMSDGCFLLVIKRRTENVFFSVESDKKIRLLKEDV